MSRIFVVNHPGQVRLTFALAAVLNKVCRENMRLTAISTRSANETSHRTGASPTHQSALNMAREAFTPRAAGFSVRGA